MKRVRIVIGQGPSDTQVLDAETGVPLAGVFEVTIHHRVNEVAHAEIKVRLFELVADGVIAVCASCRAPLDRANDELEWVCGPDDLGVSNAERKD